MPEPRAQRRLAAVVAVDVVGYSRMMGRDEQGTLARLKARFADVLQPQVDAFGGRIVKTTGDGALIEFPSAVDAVTHAIAVQQGMDAENLGLGEDEQIRFRVGINIGDVIVEDGDIYGDGVNIAARLEALAEAGGICVSGRVHDYIRQQPGIASDDLGTKTLKNIAEPVHVYRVRSANRPAPTPVSAAGRAPAAKHPTMAVLPFATMGGDPELKLFADGLTEDLITALSRVPKLRVIARESSGQYGGDAGAPERVAAVLGARYLLQGGVRGSGSRLRVTAHLIDGATGNYLWSDRYDRAAADVFAVQDDIVRRVLVEMQVELTAGETARISSRGTESLEAWLLHVRAEEALTHWNRESTLRARRLFEDAIAADPEWGLPLMGLGITLRELAVRGWGASTEEDFRKGLALIEQAVEKSADDPFITSQLGETHILMGRVDEGIPLCETALALAPNDARVLGSVAMNFIRAGRYARALDLFEKLRHVSPLPNRFNLANEGLALHMLGRHDAAAHVLDDCEEIVDARVRLAALEVDRGNGERARSIIAEVMRDNPGATVDEFSGRLIFTDADRAAWYATLLTEAGLPAR